MTIVANLLAIVVGVVVGSFVNMGLIMLAPMVVAPPAGVDPSSMESLRDNMHLMGARHFVFPFLAHALGTLAGACVAFLIARSHEAAFSYAIGGFFLAGGIVAATLIPAPSWFKALDLVLAYVPMAWAGTAIGRRIKARIRR